MEMSTMSDKRFIITKRNGSLMDVGAASVNFGPAHITFLDSKGNLAFAIHADEVREMVQDEES
jgi:hypothetical protein